MVRLVQSCGMMSFNTFLSRRDLTRLICNGLIWWREKGHVKIKSHSPYVDLYIVIVD